MPSDINLEFAGAFDLSGAGAIGVHLCPNQVDIGLAGRDPGQGDPLYLNIVCMLDLDSGDNLATIQFRLASDDSVAIADAASTEHLLTEQFSEAQFSLGAQFSFLLPTEGLVYERFLGLQYIVATSNLTAGQITAYLDIIPRAAVKSYPDASN